MSRKEYLKLLKTIIPPLSPQLHKGQAGKVVVIGGCSDYTGAPYFSAKAAALFGCDLSHVICEVGASVVIKSYSPDLMVHPYLYESDSVPPEYKSDIKGFIKKKVIKRVTSLIQRIDVAVVGPGLGRDALLLDTVGDIIKLLKERKIPIIVDADGLFLLSQDHQLIKGYDRAVLTPNVMEFKRLYESLFGEGTGSLKEEDKLQETIKLSKELGNLTIIRKGPVEYIVKGDDYVLNDYQGSNKRVGGQGDSLTGILATLLAWGHSYTQLNQLADGVDGVDVSLIAGFGASLATRIAAREAFKEKRRAMQTSDLQLQIGKAYEILTDESFKL